jgi:hypothetical protein
MTATSEVSVTISAELLAHLHRRAADSGIPLDFFIAGLVCDAIESAANGRLAWPDADSALTLSAFSGMPMPRLNRLG